MVNQENIPYLQSDEKRGNNRCMERSAPYNPGGFWLIP